MLCCAVLGCVVLCWAVLCCVVLCCDVLCGVVLCCDVTSFKDPSSRVFPVRYAAAVICAAASCRRGLAQGPRQPAAWFLIAHLVNMRLRPRAARRAVAPGGGPSGASGTEFKAISGPVLPVPASSCGTVLAVSVSQSAEFVEKAVR